MGDKVKGVRGERMGNKRLRKRIIALVAACIMLISVIPVFAANGSTTNSNMILWYDESASSLNSDDTWKQETLPIGNGILGANGYGEF